VSAGVGAGPLSLGPRGLTLALRVQPGAGRDAILGTVADAAGALALRVKVAAPAEDGRANAAVLALLAKALGLPKSALTLVKGERDRSKVVAIAGDPGAMQPRVAAWLAGMTSG
jgi:uncharacterized protein (TIGR00251 family)